MQTGGVFEHNAQKLPPVFVYIHEKSDNFLRFLATLF